MPLYPIYVTASDGTLDRRGPAGVMLAGIDPVLALVVETLLAAACERPQPGATRIITVTARDEQGAVAYRDALRVRGEPAHGSDYAAVWRAMVAMNRTTTVATDVRGFPPDQS